MNDNMTLHQLIQLYFDGETTLAQERQLRTMLSLSDDRSAEAEEARALLSFFSASRSIEPAQQLPAMSHSPKPIARKRLKAFRNLVAAAVAIAVLLGGAMLWFPSASLSAGADSGCLAYARVQGESTHDPSRIDDLIFSQLSEMSDAAGDVRQSVDEELVNMSILLNQPEKTKGLSSRHP